MGASCIKNINRDAVKFRRGIAQHLREITHYRGHRGSQRLTSRSALATRGKPRSVCYNLGSSPGRYRLGVRTEDSQSSNAGSIPGSATSSLASSLDLSCTSEWTSETPETRPLACRAQREQA